MKPEISGIYCISNNINGKKYIGQSKNIRRRIKDHVRKLNGGIHQNTHLQRAWDAHGEQNFSFSIVAEVSVVNLDEAERHYISTLKTTDSSFGYNLECGGSKNKTTSEETRRKMSESHRGEKNPMHKSKITPKRLEQLREQGRMLVALHKNLPRPKYKHTQKFIEKQAGKPIKETRPKVGTPEWVELEKHRKELRRNRKKEKYIDARNEIKEIIEKFKSTK